MTVIENLSCYKEVVSKTVTEKEDVKRIIKSMDNDEVANLIAEYSTNMANDGYLEFVYWYEIGYEKRKKSRKFKCVIYALDENQLKMIDYIVKNELLTNYELLKIERDLIYSIDEKRGDYDLAMEDKRVLSTVQYLIKLRGLGKNQENLYCKRNCQKGIETNKEKVKEVVK